MVEVLTEIGKGMEGDLALVRGFFDVLPHVQVAVVVASDREDGAVHPNLLAEERGRSGGPELMVDGVPVPLALLAIAVLPGGAGQIVCTEHSYNYECPGQTLSAQVAPYGVLWACDSVRAMGIK